MDLIQKELLEAVAGLHEIPAGAFNIRSNGKSVERRTTEHIDIISKEDGSGIDIIVKPEVRGESVHIPVIISQSGLSEAVYNDFHIGENADVTIIAGCGETLWQRRRYGETDHEPSDHRAYRRKRIHGNGNSAD